MKKGGFPKGSMYPMYPTLVTWVLGNTVVILVEVLDKCMIVR